MALTRQAWLVDELANVMQSITVVSADLTSAIDTPEARLYERGFDAALTAVSTALAIDPPRRPQRITTIGDR